MKYLKVLSLFNLILKYGFQLLHNKSVHVKCITNIELKMNLVNKKAGKHLFDMSLLLYIRTGRHELDLELK